MRSEAASFVIGVHAGSCLLGQEETSARPNPSTKPDSDAVFPQHFINNKQKHIINT